MVIKGLAHRGYPSKYPENTLSSFNAALDLSYSHLELDVNMTADGVPVVIHDHTVDRTTNSKGRVKDFTLEELRRLDAGGGERVPTLMEVLQLAKDRGQVDIELKQSGDLYTGLEEQVLKVIQACNVEDQVFLTSFDHYSIMRFRQLSKEIDLGFVIYGATPSIFQLTEQYNARYISMNYKFLTEDYVLDCKNRGIQLIAWTVDDEIDMQNILIKYPDVLICTNELEKWKKCVQTHTAN